MRRCCGGTGSDHRRDSSGHRRSTRVFCRIVKLIRGRCLMAFAKISRALSILLPPSAERAMSCESTNGRERTKNVRT
jgi:hypothetical protein